MSDFNMWYITSQFLKAVKFLMFFLELSWTGMIKSQYINLRTIPIFWSKGYDKDRKLRTPVLHQSTTAYLF